LQPGQSLKNGAYEVLSPLSKGGMGAVYLARDRNAFDRPCVIKEMLDYYDHGDPQAKMRAEARFREEGRTLAALSHPGIPKIYVFFEEDGRHFIVMEYILGENLEKYVTHADEAGRTAPRQPISEEAILGYAIQACHILEYLADQPRPVVHQDVKPANLIREPVVGDVRLVDFGTARMRYRPAGAPLGYVASSVYGTMGYAAPEQCRGEPTPRSDVYSLAATVYHLLTDDDPRDHPGQFSKLGTLRADLRSALEQALRSDPADRSTARQLREQLEAIMTPQRVVAAFTFPGGEAIRGVGAIPALSDKHWQAACEYLYSGDFERWLRDLNRLDLVEIAKTTCGRFRNRNLGLEAFLRRLDPGLPYPKLEVDPLRLDLGQVGRNGDITQTLSLRNSSRGYVKAKISTTAPWLQAQPQAAGLRANGAATTVSVAIRAHELPLFGRHQGTVVIKAGRAGRVSIPVTVQVSLWRELWRLLVRAWKGAVPGAGMGLQSSARRLVRLARWLGAGGRRHLRVVGYGYLASALGGCLGWWLATQGKDIESYAIIGLLGPLATVMVLGTASATVFLTTGLLFGALRGVWRTFWQ